MTTGARPLTRQQRQENAAFLRELRRCGNVRLAARTVGVKYGTIQHRRSRHPAFAQGWDAALAFAQARFNATGRCGPRGTDGARRTNGGEPVVVRRNDGKLQMRAAQPGKLTHACEQAFLAALSATANVRLAAAAAGASVAAFYRRRRKNPAFAREFRLALEMGYERLELALLESSQPEAFAHDDWRRNDPPAMPPMTVNQALQLLHLHQKEVRLGGEHPALKRLSPGETRQARSMRLALMYEHQQEHDRERFRIAEAERLVRDERGEVGSAAAENPLPDLSQVSGWSKASGKPATDPNRALFGGWRLRDIEPD